MNKLLLLGLFYTITVSGQVKDSVTDIKIKAGFSHSVGSKKDNYQLVYDGLYDMSGFAQNLLTLSNLFGRGLDELTCKPDEITGFNICFEKGNFFGRVLTDFGLNLIFTSWMSTIQHEFMGHGFRAREFDARINRYSVPPGIFGDAYVSIHYEDLPYYGTLLFETGGSESNMVLSRESFRQNLLNEYFYHYYFYSCALKTDLSLYILGTPKTGSSEWNNPENGSDVASYIKTFISKSADDEKKILSSARKGAFWSLVDPGLLLMFFNYTRDYIVKGRTQVKNPMIRIKNIHFLPFTDFHLSPFGFEYYIGSYLKYNQTLYETYYRWSNGNIDGKSYGFGLNMINAFQYKHFRFDTGFDLWKQDFNLLHYESNATKYYKDIFSGKIFIKTIYQINNTFSFVLQTSYKGKGFLSGNPIKSGYNAKIGMGFYF
ncbi:MAG: hypothetical protein R6X09_05485 [Bacteroidales bacterium]